MNKTKISIVRYLNAAPLAWGILEGPLAADFQPVLSTPAECADQLAAGTVDIGLIPSIEYIRIKRSKIIAGPVIACRHRVRSVLLVSNKPLWEVKTLACDTGSRTSIALAQILLKENYRVRPELRPSEPDLARMLGQCDAAVIIGDNALKFMEGNERPNAENQKAFLKFSPEPLLVFDLAERWNILTGLPFVFAFWAARAGFQDSRVTDLLKASRDFGVANTTAIAERSSETLSMKKEYLQEYLDRNVHYFMDARCVEGLQLFYEKAARIGAIRSPRSLEFL
ncbi:MAG TPA: menaquinone biosynthesis protein [Terriglobia bacterium]|nr:menaquinone biosynthesis protein [Terriglobia bacterium]